MLGPHNLAAVRVTGQGGLSGKCSSSLGCLGDTHGGLCLVDQQLRSGEQDSETKES